MDRLSKDDAMTVPDATDWLNTPLQGLRDVDSALRCQVCRDFYTTPMITSCSHTFCSLCILRCLNNDGKCPACRASAQAMNLRNNNAMEELVEAFKRARPDILAFARKPVEVSPKRIRKRSFEEAEEDAEEQVRSSQKRTRRSERNKSSSQKTPAAVVEDSDGDYIPDDGTVECPLCSRKVNMASINKHMDDGCPEEPRVTVTKALGGKDGKGFGKASIPIKEQPIKRQERLPQLNYSTYKDNALRKKLADNGLSAQGSRQMIEKRYSEWIILWNSNCDAKKPKSKSDLKRDLEIWERTLGSRATTSAATQLGSQIRDKDFDRDAWSTKHKDDFQELIANARKKAKSKTQTPPDNGAAETTGSALPEKNRATTLDTIMGGAGNGGIVIEDTPEKSTPLTTRPDTGPPGDPPSSQYQNKLDMVDNIGLPSDITLRPVQQQP